MPAKTLRLDYAPGDAHLDEIDAGTGYEGHLMASGLMHDSPTVVLEPNPVVILRDGVDRKDG